MIINFKIVAFQTFQQKAMASYKINGQFEVVEGSVQALHYLRLPTWCLGYSLVYFQLFLK